jgi:D-glycero-alpha-D-manno-heptose-7-phosphate kinase
LIISRTPYRVSFFGGGTDYPDWYLKEGGAVLSTTIDKFSYLTCRYLPPFFNVKHRVVWRHVETINSISEILHPAVRKGLQYLGYDDDRGIEIHFQGDLPARSGIGSSSSFAVGLINSLSLLKGKQLTKDELAAKAIELEQKILAETVGSQDQMAAAHGGLNVIRFSQSGAITLEPLNISEARVAELESHLMLLYTGSSRMATEIASKVTAQLFDHSDDLRRMYRMVDEAVDILKGGGSLKAFGELLDEGWMLKRSLADGVTTSQVDQIYDTARAHGCIGGKLIGAGGAGFMLFFVPPERHAEVEQALMHYRWVPFAFETDGSCIIYNDQGPVFPAPLSS